MVDTAVNEEGWSAVRSLQLGRIPKVFAAWLPHRVPKVVAAGLTQHVVEFVVFFVCLSESVDQSRCAPQ